MIADYVSTKDIQPDLVLCSTARRTLETMAGVAPAGERLIERPLYDATADQLIERLRRLPSAARSVMVIGHNPAMQMLVLKLASRPVHSRGACRGSCRRVPVRDSTQVPDGCAGHARSPMRMDQLAAGCAQLSDYVRPKALLYH